MKSTADAAGSCSGRFWGYGYGVSLPDTSVKFKACP